MLKLVIEIPDSRCVCRSYKYIYAVSKRGEWHKYKRGRIDCEVIASGVEGWEDYEREDIRHALDDSTVYRLPREEIERFVDAPGNLRQSLRLLYERLIDD